MVLIKDTENVEVHLAYIYGIPQSILIKLGLFLGLLFAMEVRRHMDNKRTIYVQINIDRSEAYANNDGSDQTARMRCLVRAFVGHKYQLRWCQIPTLLVTNNFIGLKYQLRWSQISTLLVSNTCINFVGYKYQFMRFCK